MPVYEFYCSDCHTIFNFLSRRVNTDKRPSCPRCSRPDLERQVSRFPFSMWRTHDPDAKGMPDLDEGRLVKAMMSLAGEMEGVDENDPRQMARFMRKFSDATGVELGEGFHEAMRRLEAGDDPERIEQELGDLLDEDNPFASQGMKRIRRRYVPPVHDETLYTLE